MKGGEAGSSIDAKGGRAHITIANVMQSNGVIHVVDTRADALIRQFRTGARLPLCRRAAGREDADAMHIGVHPGRSFRRHSSRRGGYRAWTAHESRCTHSQAGEELATLILAAIARRRPRGLVRPLRAHLGQALRHLPAPAAAARPRPRTCFRTSMSTVWRKAARFDRGQRQPDHLARGPGAQQGASTGCAARSTSRRPIDAAADIADDGPSALDLVEQQQERARLADCLERARRAAAAR